MLTLFCLEIYSSEATMFGAWCRKREGESRKSHSSKQHKPEPFDQLETTKGSECTRESGREDLVMPPGGIMSVDVTEVNTFQLFAK